MPARLSLRKNIAWNSTGSIVYLFFQWLVTYLVVLLLGFQDAGIFSLAISICSVAFAFALYGVRGYQVSDIKKEFNDKSYIITRIATVGLAVLGTVGYTLIYGYSLYTVLCIIAYLIFKMSEAYVDVYHGIIQKNMRMDYIGRSFILRGVITNFIFIACAVLTKNLLLSIILQAVTSFILIFLYDRRKAMIFYDKSHTTSVKIIFRMLLICLPLALYTLLSNLIMSIPRVSLESALGSEILGIYASIAIPAAVIQVVAGFIFAPVLTVFAEHINQRNFEQFHNLLYKTLGYIVSISILAIIFGSIFGDFGLKLLFGEQIANYTYLFVPILYISSLTALSWFIGLMLTVLREFTGLIVASVLPVLICLFGSKWCIDQFGISGVNYILIVSLVIQLIIMLCFMFIKIRKIKNTSN